MKKILFILGASFLLLSCSSSSSSETSKTTSLTTYKTTIGDNLIVLNGVTDQNKASLATSISQSLDKQSHKFSDPSFVDAEKYTYTVQGFDSFHCWLASSSNILRISNWAEDFANSLIPERSDSYEDDLLAFFTSSLSDAGGSSEWALSYFFNGMLGKSVSAGGANLIEEKTEIKPSPASTFKGTLPSICSQALVKGVYLDSHPEALEQLEQLDNVAIEASIFKYNIETKEAISDSAHSLTITGAVIDESKTGKERYKALLIADSDNEPCLSTLPKSFEEANQVKKEKTNSYTLYPLGSFDGKFGFYYNDTFAELMELTCLPFKNEEVLSKVKECLPYATCDKSKNGDLFPTIFSVYGENNFSDTYRLGEKISCTIAYKNRNESCSMNIENAGKEILENAISVYRNDQLVGEIKNGLSYDLKKGIQASETVYVGLELTESNLFNMAGQYRLCFLLNTNGCKEAYTMNNGPLEASFSIVTD